MPTEASTSCVVWMVRPTRPLDRGLEHVAGDVEAQREVLALGADRDVLELAARLGEFRQVALDLLGGDQQAGVGGLFVARVDAVLGAEQLGQDVEQGVVHVVAAQEGVPARGEHLEDVALDLQDGDVERAAAEVVDRDPLRHVLPEPVGEGRGGGLVEHAQTRPGRRCARRRWSRAAGHR